MHKKLVNMFIMSLVSAVLIIIVLVIGYYFVFKTRLYAKERQDNEVLVSDVVQHVENEARKMTQTASVLANYSNILSDFMQGDALQRLEKVDQIRMELSVQPDLQPGLRSIALVMKDHGRMTITSDAMNETERNAAFKVSENIIRDYEPEKTRHGVRITQSYTMLGYTYVGVLAPVYQKNGETYLGSLLLLYNGDNIRSVLPDKRGLGFTVASGSNVLAAGSSIDVLKISGDMQQIIRDTNVPGWTVNAVSNFGEIERILRNIRQLCAAVVVAITLAFAVMIIVQYRRIVNPMLLISGQVDDIGGGRQLIDLDFEVREYDRLVKSINGMLLDQRRTGEENLHIRSSVYEERIAFLQNQINPHFLYNCLESIRGMAGQENLQDVREVVSGLAMMYRSCCKGGPFATVREECECALTYERIMKKCYRSGIGGTVEYDERAEKMPVPRMMLQPLLENTVQHGFGGMKNGNGTVDVAVTLDGERLKVRIEDNGIGVPPEILEKWNSWDSWNEESADKIGLANVMRRVWLLYEENARVVFSPGAEGKGLRIVFDLPAAIPAKNVPDGKELLKI